MFRENIYDIIQATGEKIDTLLVPSNRRLNAYAKRVLLEAGLDLDKATPIAQNTLKAKGLEVILKRGEDIPMSIVDYALNGKLVLGITGDDLFDEFRYRCPSNPLSVENTYDWFDESALFFRPALCLINKSGSVTDVAPPFAISRKYEQTSLAYLVKSDITRTADFDAYGPNTIQVLEGGVDKAAGEGKVKCAIDIVYSGDTLGKYGLKVVDVVRFSDLVVISPLKRMPTLTAISKVFG